MKRINAKYVTASEAGDYYQVSFEEEWESLTNYFLIQWGFEFEDIVPDEPYIESDDLMFCGRPKFEKIEFNRNRFYLQLADEDKNELEINFDIPDKDYKEGKRILEIILSGYDFIKVD
ncbi:hypothetical protein B6I21_00800 [candidate division KSB1 bacterium 4572_119]|nr:MAG: hypothetical protein B6I21_00800 [candidate division KSB1 bacterium 4572_119]